LAAAQSNEHTAQILIAMLYIIRKSLLGYIAVIVGDYEVAGPDEDAAAGYGHVDGVGVLHGLRVEVG